MAECGLGGDTKHTSGGGQTFIVDSGSLSLKASSFWRFLSGNMVRLNRASNCSCCICRNEVRFLCFFHVAGEQRWRGDGYTNTTSSPQNHSHESPMTFLQPGLESERRRSQALTLRGWTLSNSSLSWFWRFSWSLLGNATSSFSLYPVCLLWKLAPVSFHLPYTISRNSFFICTQSAYLTWTSDRGRWLPSLSLSHFVSFRNWEKTSCPCN